MKSHTYTYVFNYHKGPLSIVFLYWARTQESHFKKASCFQLGREDPSARKILKGGSFKDCTSHKRKPGLPNARIFMG